jgi:hypothetical protein
MAEDATPILENALLAVLPLFTISVTSHKAPVISGAEIDNRIRKLQTFNANFLVEVHILARTLEYVVESRSRKNKVLDNTNSDEYVENLGKVLALFDSLVSDEVPGRTFKSNLVRIYSYRNMSRTHLGFRS